ncbi:MAG: ABC transporter permease [Deltaproteobacteria bacterium]|nr:ABC transporter permease [Deltaproteobacteria bacterium]
MRRLLYFTGKALASVRASPGVSLLTAATISAALVLAGLYAMAVQNMEGLALVWGRTATLAAYVSDSTPRTDWQALRDRLGQLDAVERAVLVTPLEAIERFKARGPAAAALVDGLAEEVLPASIELHLRGGFADLAAVEALAARIRTVPGIADVDYGQQEFERLAALIDILRYGGLAAGLLVLIATAFIVANTIRLTVYTRRDEIAILRLVGATRWFVRTPFLIEGGLWGLAAGLLALALLALADWAVAPRITAAVADVVGGLDVHLYEASVAMGLVVAGVGLGVVGSALAVGRFLDVDEV